MTAAAASPHRAVLYPTEEVFLPDTLGRPRSTPHSGMAGAKAAVASYPPRHRADVPSVPNSGHAMRGVGAGFAVNGDRIPASWPLRR